MLIHVEILPWLSNSMRPNQLGSIKFEHESSGTSFRDLLEELSKADPAFANLIYDSEAGEMRYPASRHSSTGNFCISRGLDAKISDGDIVTFIATYTGG